VSGAKLRKTVYTGGTVTLTQDYVSGFVYKNGSLDFFFTEEGRVKSLEGNLRYEYNLSDHLGNSRATFIDNNGTPQLIEESHYYAFGMRIEGLSTSNADNKFTYNGKELEDDHGLNWYHYGARFYDPQIGRWHAVDPEDEFNSPYLFVGNNPLRLVDPDGSSSEDPPQALDQTPSATDAVLDGLKEVGEETLHSLFTVEGWKQTVTGAMKLYHMSTLTPAGIEARTEAAMAVQAVIDEYPNMSSYDKTKLWTKVVANSALAIVGTKGAGALRNLKLVNSEGFLIGSISMRSPINISVQRFGAMAISSENAWGLRLSSSQFITRHFSAVLPKWNDLSVYTTGVIPKGTPIKIGITAPQTPFFVYPGGLPQINVMSRNVINQMSTFVRP
jgi:RHS repeat-associated protein